MSAYEIEHGGDVVTVRTDDVKEGWWLRWHWDATARDKVGMEVIRAT